MSSIHPPCPWASYSPATISFCETRLCTWIVEPANTWSNLAYIFIGIYILYLERGKAWSMLSTIGITAILVGIGSFSFHATGTFWGEFLDISAMFFIGGQFIVFSLDRLRSIKQSTLIFIYFAICGFFMTLLYLFQSWGIGLFVVLVTIAVLLQARIYFKKSGEVNYRYLKLLVSFFIVSFIFWRLDITKRWCGPYQHFLNGHALWHVINSFCLLFFYKFQLQFQKLVKPEEKRLKLS